MQNKNVTRKSLAETIVVSRGRATVNLVGLFLVLALLGCAQSGFIKVHREEATPDRRTVHTTEVRQPPGSVTPASLSFELEPIEQVDAESAKAQSTSPSLWSMLTGKSGSESAVNTGGSQIENSTGQSQSQVAAKPAAQSASASTSHTIRPQSSQRLSIRASTGAQQANDQALAQLTWLPAVGVGLCVLGVLLIVAKAWVPLLPLELGVGLLLLGVAVIALPMLLDRYLWLLILAGIFFFAINVWRLNKLESVRQFLGLNPAESQPLTQAEK